MTDERLTRLEILALLDAAGNIDPCMFIEDMGGKVGERRYEAWLSGQEKLRRMLVPARERKPRKKKG